MLTYTGNLSSPAAINSVSLLSSDRKFNLALKDTTCKPLGHKLRISLIWYSEGAQALNLACCTCSRAWKLISISHACSDGNYYWKAQTVWCTVMHRKLNFIIRYTHLIPIAVELDSFRHVLGLRRAPHISLLSQYFHFFSLFAPISILRFHHILQLILGWLLNWETFSLLVQIHSCSF